MTAIPPRHKVLVVITAILTLIIAVFIIQSLDKVNNSDLALTAAACDQNLDCLSESLADIIEKDGLEMGLSQIDSFSKISNIPCHDISHATGVGMYKRIGEKIFKFYEYYCQGGFTHGWMANYGVNQPIESYIDKFTLYCKEAKAYTSCVHGIGHSLGENNVSIKTISAICLNTESSILPFNTIKSTPGSCIEGWVMGNSELFNKWLEKGIKEAVLFCSTLDENLQIYCFGQVYAQWIDEGGGIKEERIKSLYNFCDTFMGENYKLCTNYLGEVIGTIPNSTGGIEDSIRYANNLCSLDNINNNCLDSVLFVLSSSFSNDKDLYLATICSALKTEFYEKCKLFTNTL